MDDHLWISKIIGKKHMEKRTLDKNKGTIYLALILSLIIFFYLYNPTKIFYPPCPFCYLTGFYCPGCGTSRAIYQIVHGNFLYALNLNPLMILSLPFLFYLVMCNLNIKIGEKLIFKRRVFTKKFYVMLIAVIVLYWILRNIPIYPFSILAP